MRVVIAGGHGKIGLRLLERLAAAGHDSVGLVRNAEHVAELQAAGGQGVVLDLEHAALEDVTAAVRGADAVVFAAGSGPGSGAARKLSMDRDGAVLLADAAVAAGVGRYLMVSSMNAEEPADGAAAADALDPDEDVFAVYLRAKGAADAALRRRDLGWLILRPGGLTDEPGRGRVHLAESVPRGDVPRDDVAAVLHALIDAGAVHRTLELVGGDTEIDAAVGAI